ncbi:hypothetical protein B0T17DRAFT_543515 [Bombardia bombarda]|uniref:Secreted protein n=1 Tax=Bombardia bombarda TaxID=252184 RepID=A0AA39WD03_9PEZI|nr:hypothetical protein B0T17DRAFT_543515 [Bombardia bombarda]
MGLVGRDQGFGVLFFFLLCVSDRDFLSQPALAGHTKLWHVCIVCVGKDGLGSLSRWLLIWNTGFSLRLCCRFNVRVCAL